jgi:hypothetical protein
MTASKAALVETREKPLSDWDLPLFVEMGLLETPPGSEFFPYVDAILLGIAMAKFQRFWEWLLMAAKPSDLQAIAAAAEGFAASEKMAYSSPEALRSMPL